MPQIHRRKCSGADIPSPPGCHIASSGNMVKHPAEEAYAKHIPRLHKGDIPHKRIQFCYTSGNSVEGEA